MEIKIEDKIFLDSNQIIGIIDYENYLIDYLKQINFSKTNIILDGKKLTSKELCLFKRYISIIDDYILDDYLNFTVYEYMKYKIFTNFLDIKDYRKKIIDSLKIAGLNESYLDKKISNLSKSEQQWINFSVGMLSNPNIIVLKNCFNSFDLKNSKKMIRLLQQLVEKYQKIVIINTTNSEIIYKYTKKTIIIKDKEVFIEAETENIFKDNFDLLLNNNFEIPKIVAFSNLVNNKKNIKLGYFKDIRDLIKDIYKKV